MTNARPVLLPTTSSTGVSPSTLPAVEYGGDDRSARVAIEPELTPPTCLRSRFARATSFSDASAGGCSP
jgi:hypothetical protein